MSVMEDKVPGEEVGRLKADDPDQGDNGLVNYRIVDGDGMGVFELSTDSETREAVVKLKKVMGVGASPPARNLCFFPPVLNPTSVDVGCQEGPTFCFNF